MIQAVTCHQRPRQMVWASIWLDERGKPRRSPLVIMERDPTAKKNGYSAKSYIKALKKGLLPHWRRTQLFMQDNASIHRAKHNEMASRPRDYIYYMARVLTRP